MFLYSTVSTLNPVRTQHDLQFSLTRAHSFRRSHLRQEIKQPVGLPIVGMVVTISPSFSLYRIVVLPAASRPTCSGRGYLSSSCKPKHPQPTTSWDLSAGLMSAYHENPHLFSGEEAGKQLGKSEPHLPLVLRIGKLCPEYQANATK